MTPWRARRLRRLLSLWGPLVAISVTSVVVALLLWRHLESTSSARARFYRAWSNDENELAETIAWRMVKKDPMRLAWWVRFTEAHSDVYDDEENSPITEGEVRQWLKKLTDSRVSAIASYFYAVRMDEKGEPDASAVLPLADANPPAPYANFVLAEGALAKKDWRSAGARYERETLSKSEVVEACRRRALRTWLRHDEWNAVRKRIDDPHWARAANAGVRLDLAVHDHDVPRVLWWAWPASYVDVSAWPVALALLAAALWFWIATRLGRIHDDDVRGRVILYVTAFILGVLSIYPTIITVTIEDALGFDKIDQAIPDLIFYVFGVGLREEAWKAILFLPLLGPLLRRGSRIEAMTCGALVGLGFAAEENIGYFEHGADAALPRFLTANFLHMSLTALVALAMFDTMRRRTTSLDAFKVVFPLAVAVHGLYDFCLDIGGLSLFAVILLVIIARRFLRQLLIASSREDERDVLNVFVGAMAAITGAAYIYATTLAGPISAFRMIAFGALTVAVVIYIFVKELSPA